MSGWHLGRHCDGCQGNVATFAGLQDCGHIGRIVSV
jgi:hypothetical protein